MGIPVMRITALIAIALLLTKAGLSAASLLALDLRTSTNTGMLDKRLARLLDEGLRDRAERREAQERVGEFAIFLHLREAAAFAWSAVNSVVSRIIRHNPHRDTAPMPTSVTGFIALSQLSGGKLCGWNPMPYERKAGIHQAH
ncbi:hypothetical protein JKG47_00925 [Acidithiobacillus sp. MC6.1]|nr:hypothetical protein [Acidithiobacillus sp. MC6.1]